MANKDYNSKSFTISSHKVSKTILEKPIDTLNNLHSYLGSHDETLTDDDLFISMKLSWALRDNHGLSNTFDFISQNLILDKSPNIWYEDYFHLDLVNTSLATDTNRYYIDGRVSYKFNGTFELQSFYNILVDNQDGTKKVYTKELTLDHFKGNPLIMNADKEYQISIANPLATLSKVYLEYNTKEV